LIIKTKQDEKMIRIKSVLRFLILLNFSSGDILS
jgi:hypothetical protein